MKQISILIILFSFDVMACIPGDQDILSITSASISTSDNQSSVQIQGYLLKDKVVTLSLENFSALTAFFSIIFQNKNSNIFTLDQKARIIQQILNWGLCTEVSDEGSESLQSSWCKLHDMENIKKSLQNQKEVDLLNYDLAYYIQRQVKQYETIQAITVEKKGGAKLLISPFADNRMNYFKDAHLGVIGFMELGGVRYYYAQNSLVESLYRTVTKLTGYLSGQFNSFPTLISEKKSSLDKEKSEIFSAIQTPARVCPLTFESKNWPEVSTAIYKFFDNF